MTASFIDSRSLGCHATRFFCASCDRYDVLSYNVEEARKKKLPFTLGDDALICIESVLSLGGIECRKYW